MSGVGWRDLADHITVPIIPPTNVLKTRATMEKTVSPRKRARVD